MFSIFFFVISLIFLDSDIFNPFNVFIMKKQYIYLKKRLMNILVYYVIHLYSVINCFARKHNL